MTSSSTFYYSPYLVDSAAKPRAWVVTAGLVISYGIASPPVQASEFDPSVEAEEVEQDNEFLPLEPVTP